MLISKNSPAISKYSPDMSRYSNEAYLFFKKNSILINKEVILIYQGKSNLLGFGSCKNPASRRATRYPPFDRKSSLTVSTSVVPILKISTKGLHILSTKGLPKNLGVLKGQTKT